MKGTPILERHLYPAQVLRDGALNQRPARSHVPAYLWTTNPDNLPYYHSHGYEITAEDVMPGGATTWYMERPAA